VDVTVPAGRFRLEWTGGSFLYPVIEKPGAIDTEHPVPLVGTTKNFRQLSFAGFCSVVMGMTVKFDKVGKDLQILDLDNS